MTSKWHKQGKQASELNRTRTSAKLFHFDKSQVQKNSPCFVFCFEWAALSYTIFFFSGTSHASILSPQSLPHYYIYIMYTTYTTTESQSQRKPRKKVRTKIANLFQLHFYIYSYAERTKRCTKGKTVHVVHFYFTCANQIMQHLKKHETSPRLHQQLTDVLQFQLACSLFFFFWCFWQLLLRTTFMWSMSVLMCTIDHQWPGILFYLFN